jgi:hypothetical protein
MYINLSIYIIFIISSIFIFDGRIIIQIQKSCIVVFNIKHFEGLYSIIY